MRSFYQERGGKLPSFVARLQQLTKYCKFGMTLDEMLCDQFVCGITDEQIRQLLAKAELTFNSALKVAQAYKSAETNVQVLRSNTATLSTAEIHATHRAPEPK